MPPREPHHVFTFCTHLLGILVVKQQKCRSSAIPPCGLPPHRLGRDAPSPPQLSTCLLDKCRGGSAFGGRYPTCVVDVTDKLVTVFCFLEKEGKKGAANQRDCADSFGLFGFAEDIQKATIVGPSGLQAAHDVCEALFRKLKATLPGCHLLKPR